VTTISIVSHSLGGRTGRQAEAVLKGCQAASGVTTHLLRLTPEQIGPGLRWRTQEFKDKFAGGFTNSAAINGDKQVTPTPLQARPSRAAA
jgi:hypothetical protein